ncbi:response regulator [Flavimaricola marinus]|uniref:Response regulator receiver domain protein n=1 Tax=Flavimaricola marinus TaxID=1819565 RepID=A0A238LAQ3_9RHOB|nr:response regulator [Flavimaricola marinus]SMY06504.1 Response regulator receiver domain protein [Flavimaricola marinus]
MRVLIVESEIELANIWRRHLERLSFEVHHAETSDLAVEAIGDQDFDVIILNLILAEGSALAVSDYAQYRQPNTNVIFVTDTSFFSDGSIFSMTPNARALVRTGTKPEDLAAMVEHYGSHAETQPV